MRCLTLTAAAVVLSTSFALAGPVVAPDSGPVKLTTLEMDGVTAGGVRIRNTVVQANLAGFQGIANTNLNIAIVTNTVTCTQVLAAFAINC